MSATLTFLPWTRLGIGRTLAVQPGALRAQVPIAVRVGGRIGAAAAPIFDAPPLSAQTLGPGDVLGLDPRVVIRAEPGPYAQGVPARALVSVEFSRPDFPWMFSPLLPDAQQRLQPWICLLVVPQRPGIALRSRTDGRLPVLTVDSGAELPDLSEAWAWAHVQSLMDDGSSLGTTVGAADERTLSRVISPRRLDIATSYYACLVPTFNVGRQAGLDPSAEPTGPLGPAWSGTIAGSFDVPVYHAWTFSTGEGGDFHDLVVKLRPQVLPVEVGWRPMRVEFPTTPAPATFQPFTVPIEGVLRNLHDPPPVTDASAVTAVAQELRRITTLARTVAPPRYGQAQATAGSSWLDGLNNTPAFRVAAGTGARVVQAQQDELIAAAWEQVADLQRTNQERRHADVALVVGESVMRRHLGVMTADCVLQVSAPTNVPIAGGVNGPAGIAGVPAALLTGTFRRLQRRTGSLARRTSVAAGGARLKLIALPLLSSSATAMGVIDRGRLLQTSPDLVAPKTAAVLPFSDAEAVPAGHTNAKATYTFHGTIPADPEHGIFKPTPVNRDVVVLGATVPWRLDDATQFSTDTDAAALARRQATANNFKAAALAIQHYLFDQVLPRANTMVIFKAPPPTDDGVLTARTTVLEALRPARTVLARVVSRTAPDPTGGTSPGPSPGPPEAGPSPLAPLRYDPVFAQGMFRAIADLSPDLFVVGVDRMPDNSVGAMRLNARFIESYLVGLNHEMGRELVWRGFPSDGRGTYFRSFWDADLYPPLSAWRGALGANLPPRDWVVLVVRGELVRRYPRAVVFAQRGALDASGTHFTPGPEPRRYPMFRITLGGDLLCVGFDLARAQALTHFFGIEEQITEPRFAALTAPTGPFVNVSELSLGASAHAGHVAAATLRRPVRVMVDAHLLIT